MDELKAQVAELWRQLDLTQAADLRRQIGALAGGAQQPAAGEGIGERKLEREREGGRE